MEWGRQPRLEGVRILVVEDELTFQALMMIALGEEGATVETADDAQSALELAKTFKPQVLISDISLPEEDGFWLRRQITEHIAASEVPCSIALTGYSGAEAEEALRESGFDKYLGKPVDLEVLIDAARDLLIQKQQR